MRASGKRKVSVAGSWNRWENRSVSWKFTDGKERRFSTNLVNYANEEKKDWSYADRRKFLRSLRSFACLLLFLYRYTYIYIYVYIYMPVYIYAHFIRFPKRFWKTRDLAPTHARDDVSTRDVRTERRRNEPLIEILFYAHLHNFCTRASTYLYIYIYIYNHIFIYVYVYRPSSATHHHACSL